MSTQTAARPLTMALSKGRIFEETLPLLGAAELQPLLDAFEAASRKAVA